MWKVESTHIRLEQYSQFGVDDGSSFSATYSTTPFTNDRWRRCIALEKVFLLAIYEFDKDDAKIYGTK